MSMSTMYIALLYISLLKDMNIYNYCIANMQILHEA